MTEPERGMTSSRSLWIDVARGIGIVLVVYGHVLRGFVSRGLIAAPWAKLHDSVLYAFHMPLFFFLSGLLIERGLRKGRIAFVFDKLPTIVWPYLVWSVVQTVLAHYFSPGTPTDVGLAALLRIYAHPIAEYWFLYALILCQILIAVTGTRRWLLLLISAIGLSGAAMPIPTMGAIALGYFPFVAAGMIIAPAILNTAKGTGRGIMFAITLAAIGVFLAAFPFRSALVTTPLATIWSSAIAFIGITIVIGVSIFARQWLTWLAPIGRASMAIYLLHTIFVAAARMVALALDVSVGAPLVVALTLFGLAAPMALYALTSRYGLSLRLALGHDDPAYREKSST
jgi:fucose 4-O-acetylase-like acetyltransferase